VAQFPSSTNVFIKSHEASGSLIVDFSRDPSTFAVSEYAQIVPVKKPSGLYQVMTVEEAGRVLGADAAEYDWADGADAPDGSDGTESFDYPQFQTRRSAYPYRLGQRTVDNAEWEIAAQHGRIHAQKAMTVRTMRAVTALTTSGNYDSTHVSAISGGSITGTTGTWAQSTSTRQDIKRSLNHAAELIMLDTLSAIDIDELMVVISPTLAKEMSVSQEIVDMIKQSSDAKYYVSGEGKFTNKNAKVRTSADAVRLPDRDRKHGSRHEPQGRDKGSVIRDAGVFRSHVQPPWWNRRRCWSTVVFDADDVHARRNDGRNQAGS
jgi:hypothetical protein